MDQKSNGILFDEALLTQIREKFCNVDVDIDGSFRLFFENAGGSLRLKSVIEISNELNQFPDCYAREHKSSRLLQSYVAAGQADLKVLFNAKSGAIATSLTASELMFKIVEPIVQYGAGSNIVTSVLEHPSAYDACKLYAQKYDKELRVAPSNPKTGGIDAEAVLKLVDKDTLLINVIAASNMTGAMTDLKTIAHEARKINPDIFIVSDAVQHAPHGLIDVDELTLDGVTVAPYKFFGNRGIAFAYVSDRVKNLPHVRILDDEPDIWELGSLAPAHYGAISEIVNYLAWIGEQFIQSSSKNALVAEGMRRIHLHEQALLHMLLYGTETVEGLLSMPGVDAFFDYSRLDNRDLILAIKLNNLDYYNTVREYEARNIIVFERVATSAFSRRMVESLGLDGIIRVSPLHCNTPAEFEKFLIATKEITELY